MPETENQRLSRLLFEAREVIDMYSDIVTSRLKKEDQWLTGLKDDIDEYRKEHGWSPSGFGDEDESPDQSETSPRN